MPKLLSRKFTGFIGAAVFGLAMMGMAGSAHAVLITETYEFTASDFSILAGPGPVPVDPVEGSFTVTYDPLVSISDSTNIVVNSLNVNYASTMVFTYISIDAFFIIGANGSAAGYGGSVEDFQLIITSVSNDPTFSQLSYSQAPNFPNQYRTFTGTVTRVPNPPPCSYSARA